MIKLETHCHSFGSSCCATAINKQLIEYIFKNDFKNIENEEIYQKAMKEYKEEII